MRGYMPSNFIYNKSDEHTINTKLYLEFFTFFRTINRHRSSHCRSMVELVADSSMSLW